MIISIFILGSALTIIGGLIGIDSPSIASWLLNISLALQITAVVFLTVKLVKSIKTNSKKK